MIRYQFLRFPEGKAKAVTLSYDDGCADDLHFSDVITQYGLKCTFNLNGISYRGEKSFSLEKAEKYIFSRGHEAAVHGWGHRAEGHLRPIEGIREVLDCRLELEAEYGRIIRGMAFPDSGITKFTNTTSYEDVKKYLTDLGIVYARSLAGDNNEFRLPRDWHNWVPTAHHTNPKLLEWIEEFVNFDVNTKYKANRFPRLFYLWGHSFEFAREGNWDLLDRIGETLGGKEDIWYCTNIELYEYVEAYERLVYSADGRRIYNPTQTLLFFAIDGEDYKIAPGETLFLADK